MRFWLGVHDMGWMRQTAVPLFVSARRLRDYRTLHRATCPWALDSGGFSELSMYGAWQTSPRQYADEAQRWAETVGGMEWAAIQDWMCEPFMLAKTGLTIREHQKRTVASYHKLTKLAPSIPWVPVLQGWQLDDYLNHVTMYRKSGVTLSALPLVGLGSVCRRQSAEIGAATWIVSALSGLGIRLHAFGFKLTGLRACAHWLTSADSMAWSDQARKESAYLPGCTHGGLKYRPRLKRVDYGNCANCLKYALQWREKVEEAIRCQSIPN